MFTFVDSAPRAIAPCGRAPAPASRAVEPVNSNLSRLLQHGLTLDELQRGFTTVVVFGNAAPAQAVFAEPASIWTEVGVGLHAESTFIKMLQADFKDLIGVNQSVRNASQAAKDRQGLRALAAAYVFDLPHDEAKLQRLSTGRGVGISEALALCPEDVVFQLKRIGWNTLCKAQEVLARRSEFSHAEQQDYRRAMEKFKGYVGDCIRRVRAMSDT